MLMFLCSRVPQGLVSFSHFEMYWDVVCIVVGEFAAGSSGTHIVGVRAEGSSGTHVFACLQGVPRGPSYSFMFFWRGV